MNKTFKKIAVDIVILPPTDVMKKLININQQAASQNAVRGPLAKDDFFPHLSLAMGCIKFNDLKTIKNTIKDIIKKFDPIIIKLNKLDFAENPDGSRDYVIQAKNTPELQQLHENLMNGLQKYFLYNCTKEMLYTKPGEEVNNPNYINKFLATSSFKAFDPHITTRTTVAMGQEILPIKFIATQISACHVGTKTTCRKILFSVKIND